MSQENVESVLTMWAASMEGDPAELDLSLLAEDIVYEDDIPPDHGSETYHGHDGIRRAWARACRAKSKPPHPLSSTLGGGATRLFPDRLRRDHGKRSKPAHSREAASWASTPRAPQPHRRRL